MASQRPGGAAKPGLIYWLSVAKPFLKSVKPVISYEHDDGRIEAVSEVG